MTSDLIPVQAVQQQLALGERPHAPLVLDLRRGSQFRRARIPGSHHMSVARLLSGEPPDRDLILVAASNQQATTVAEALHASGFHRRIQQLEGGLEGWRQAGYAVEGSGGTLQPVLEHLVGALTLLLPNPRRAWRRRAA